MFQHLSERGVAAETFTERRVCLVAHISDADTAVVRVSLYAVLVLFRKLTGAYQQHVLSVVSFSAHRSEYAAHKNPLCAKPRERDCAVADNHAAREIRKLEYKNRANRHRGAQHKAPKQLRDLESEPGKALGIVHSCVLENHNVRKRNNRQQKLFIACKAECNIAPVVIEKKEPEPDGEQI